VPATSYEFSAQENRELDGLAGRMRAVGWLLFVVGVLAAAEWVFLRVKGSGNAMGLVVGPVLFLIGFWSRRAGNELSQVVRTAGADIQHLMRALHEVRKLYELQFWAFVLLAIVFSLAMLGFVTGPGRVGGPYP